jgi:hypothetical protein
MKLILSIIFLLITGCSQDKVKIETTSKKSDAKNQQEIAIKKEETVFKPVKKINYEKVNQLKEELKEQEAKLAAIIKEQLHFPKEAKRYRNLEENKTPILEEIKELKKEIWKETN